MTKLRKEGSKVFFEGEEYSIVQVFGPDFLDKEYEIEIESDMDEDMWITANSPDKHEIFLLRKPRKLCITTVRPKSLTESEQIRFLQWLVHNVSEVWIG